MLTEHSFSLIPILLLPSLHNILSLSSCTFHFFEPLFVICWSSLLQTNFLLFRCFFRRRSHPGVPSHRSQFGFARVAFLTEAEKCQSENVLQIRKCFQIPKCFIQIRKYFIQIQKCFLNPKMFFKSENVLQICITKIILPLTFDLREPMAGTYWAQWTQCW